MVKMSTVATRTCVALRLEDTRSDEKSVKPKFCLSNEEAAPLNPELQTLDLVFLCVVLFSNLAHSLWFITYLYRMSCPLRSSLNTQSIASQYQSFKSIEVFYYCVLLNINISSHVIIQTFNGVT